MEQAQTTPSNNNGGLTTHDAGQAISQLLQKESGGPRNDKGQFAKPQEEASPAPQPQPEPSQEEAAPIESSESAADATDDIEIDDGQSTEAAQQPDIEMPKSLSSTDHDEWSKLTPEAKAIIARRETQREAGMNKLASQLKTKEKELSDALAGIETERKQLATHAGRYASEAQRKFQAEFGDVKDPGQLAATDPARFLRYQAAQMAVGQAVQEAQAHEQQQAEAFNKSMMEFRQAENAKVIATLNLDTPDKMKAFEEKMVKAAETDGIPLTRLQQYTASELLTYNDALKWRAAVAKRAAVEKQNKQPPKVVKPGTPSQSTAHEQQAASAMKAHQKQGTVDTAAAALRLRLGGRT